MNLIYYNIIVIIMLRWILQFFFFVFFLNHLLQIQQGCGTLLLSVDFCEVSFIFGICYFQLHFLTYTKTRTNKKRKKKRATVRLASGAEASLERGNDWN